jgi:hypothetical protein
VLPLLQASVQGCRRRGVTVVAFRLTGRSESRDPVLSDKLLVHDKAGGSTVSCLCRVPRIQCSNILIGGVAHESSLNQMS